MTEKHVVNRNFEHDYCFTSISCLTKSISGTGSLGKFIILLSSNDLLDPIAEVGSLFVTQSCYVMLNDSREMPSLDSCLEEEERRN